MPGFHTLIAELNGADELADAHALLFANWATSDIAEGCAARLKALRLGELRPAELAHPGAAVGACVFLKVLSPEEQDAAIASLEETEAESPDLLAETRRVAHRANASFGVGALPSEDRVVYPGDAGDPLGCCASEVGEPVSSRPGEYELVYRASAGGTRSAFLTFRGGEGCPEGITEECLLAVLADRLRQRFGEDGDFDATTDLRELLAAYPWGWSQHATGQCPDCLCDCSSDHAQPLQSTDEVT